MVGFPNELDFLVRREQCKDLLRYAGKDRIIKQIRVGRERRNHLYCRALAWLGYRLAAWGGRLQQRYGAVTASPVLGAAPHTR